MAIGEWIFVPNSVIFKPKKQLAFTFRRYAEDNSKYAHLKPGVIRFDAFNWRFSLFKLFSFSDDLRRAVGLQHRELPLWIYQMRILGYPPGHLIDAFSQPSNLTMFDDNSLVYIIFCFIFVIRYHFVFNTHRLSVGSDRNRRQKFLRCFENYRISWIQCSFVIESRWCKFVV